VQHRDLALGAVDGVVDQVELDLEFFALLDLGAVGLEQRMRFRDLARDGGFRGFLHRRAPGATGHLRGCSEARP